MACASDDRSAPMEAHCHSACRTCGTAVSTPCRPCTLGAPAPARVGEKGAELFRASAPVASRSLRAMAAARKVVTIDVVSVRTPSVCAPRRVSLLKARARPSAAAVTSTRLTVDGVSHYHRTPCDPGVLWVSATWRRHCCLHLRTSTTGRACPETLHCCLQTTQAVRPSMTSSLTSAHPYVPLLTSIRVAWAQGEVAPFLSQSCVHVAAVRARGEREGRRQESILRRQVRQGQVEELHAAPVAGTTFPLDASMARTTRPVF